MSDLPYLNTRSRLDVSKINFSEYGYDYENNNIIRKTFKNNFDNLLLKYTFSNKQKSLGLSKEQIEPICENSDYDSEDEYCKYSKEEEEYLKKVEPKTKEIIEKIEKEIDNYVNNEIPLRFKIILTDIDLNTKKKLLEKHDMLLQMDENCNEYYKLSDWFLNLEKIPFNKYSKVENININSKLNKCKEYLDNAVYGHNESKIEILQMYGNMISNPKSKGHILGLQGPPGNGKTTIIKNGLSKALNKPFYFIGLGGMTDAAHLYGHGYTYEGSQVGLLVNALQRSNVMDPIIYFDELDKVSNTDKGNEIYNLLCHITDPVQNMEYEDKFLNGVKIDLSRITWIFSFNCKENINPILLDRLKVIETKGYQVSDKIKIANTFLIKDICQNINFNIDKININDDIIKHIIINYTQEEGVRTLKKHLNTIISYINLYLMLDKNNNLDGLLSIKIDNKKNPIIINKILVDNLLKKKDVSDIVKNMYI